MLTYLPLLAGAIAAVVVPAVLGRSVTREAKVSVRVQSGGRMVFRGSRRAQLAMLIGCTGVSALLFDGKLRGSIVGSWLEWGVFIGAIMIIGIAMASVLHRMRVEVDDRGISATGAIGRRRSMDWSDIASVSVSRSGKLTLEGTCGDQLSFYLMLRGACALLDVLEARVTVPSASRAVTDARRKLGVCG